MSQHNDKSQREQADAYGIQEGDVVEITLSSTLDTKRMECVGTRGTPNNHPEEWTHFFRHWETGYFLTPDAKIMTLKPNSRGMREVGKVESMRVVDAGNEGESQ